MKTAKPTTDANEPYTPYTSKQLGATALEELQSARTTLCALMRQLPPIKQSGHLRDAIRSTETAIARLRDDGW